MKKYTIIFIASLFISCLLIIGYGCDEEEENNNPTCSITAPLQNAEIMKGEAVTITVDADDEDGNLEEVRFYIDDLGISSTSTFPYTYEWNTSEVSGGIHILKAEAVDEKNAKTEDSISIEIIDSVIDYDGNEYKLVQIGNQVWMAENLKTTHYADGTEITLVESNTVWDALTYADKVYCYYDNSTTNADTYGALYTWAAAMNGAISSDANPSGVQGVCPDGWHLPSDAEWAELTNYLTNDGHSGTEGTALKSTSGWINDGNGTDNYGFTALPGGSRYINGVFTNLSDASYFWSVTENSSSDAWRCYLYSNSSDVGRSYYYKNSGFSVRCVKD